MMDDWKVDNERVAVGRASCPAWSSSAWLFCGWTLQELIAPRVALFYDHSWELIGYRTDFASDLKRITGVPYSVICRQTSPDKFSVAERMS